LFLAVGISLSHIDLLRHPESAHEVLSGISEADAIEERKVDPSIKYDFNFRKKSTVLIFFKQHAKYHTLKTNM